MDENNCGLASLNRAHAFPTILHKNPHFTPLFNSTSKNLHIKKSAGVGTSVPAPKQRFNKLPGGQGVKNALIYIYIYIYIYIVLTRINILNIDLNVKNSFMHFF